MRFKAMAVVAVVAPVFLFGAIASAHVIETPNGYGFASGDFAWEGTALAPEAKSYVSPVSRPLSIPSSTAGGATRWMTRRVWRIRPAILTMSFPRPFPRLRPGQ